jgi:predicted O-methyltransferase YrrM
MTMKTDPYSVLEDNKVATVLRRLHAEAARQTPGLLLHYLPKLPAMLLGRRMEFSDDDLTGFYADKFIALEPEQAAFAYLTARSLRATCVVEFGSSFGISTIWLAAAVRANGGGRVIGTELVETKAARARQHLREAGLDDLVEIRVGDAMETLRVLDHDVDLLLNDGFPMRALDIVKLLAHRMRPGAVVLTDNVGTFRANYREYVAFMRDRGNGFASTLLPFKSGTEYSVRLGSRDA